MTTAQKAAGEGRDDESGNEQQIKRVYAEIRPG